MKRAANLDDGIPVALNGGLAAIHITANVYQYFVLPLWLLPNEALWAWTLLPLAFLNNPLWSLIHEAIHDLLHPRRAINLRLGRMLSIIFGSPFRVLRLSHLLHHKLNRTPMEGTELYERGGSSIVAAACGYYCQILGGLYLAEFLSPLLLFLPSRWVQRCNDRFMKRESISGILMRNWTQEEALWEIRVDGLLIYAWVGGAFLCYGARWPLLVALLAARGFLISFLDNVYHYRTPVNDIFYASNLSLPKVAAGILLNFNFHGVHHQNPAISWNNLPIVFMRNAQVFHGNYLLAAARQLRGPVALDDLPRSG